MKTAWISRPFLRLLQLVFGVRRRVVQLPAGFSMRLDPASILGSELIRRGEYERRLTNLIRGLLRERDVVVDVGAHEGYITLHAATAARDVHVHSIEPHPNTAGVLRSNIELNHLENVVVHELALADQAGSAHLTSPRHTGSTRLAQLDPAAAPAFTVSTVTLDEFLARHHLDHVRLVKVDCEGAEIFVFRGATSTLARQAVEYFVVDYHHQIIGAANCREIDGRLRGAGYLCTSVDGLWVYHLPEGLADLARIGATEPVPPV